MEDNQTTIDEIVKSKLPFLTTWYLEPNSKEELKQAKAIISFAFGFGPIRKDTTKPLPRPEKYHPNLYNPGLVNEELASTIIGLYEEGIELPIWAQWEVAEALKDKIRSIQIPENQIALPDKGYLGTSGVVEQMLDKGLGHYFDPRTVILVAHPLHAFRCREIAKTASRKKKTPLEILVAPTKDVYDSESIQPWTRSVEEWINYEICARFNNYFLGNMEVEK